jgi:DNA-directed RNA polymerase subunit E'/Rpb7
METTAYFERKVGLTPRDLNKLGGSTVDEILMEKLRETLEEKCSEHGYILPGSLKILSRSMGFYEAARFTGEAVYQVKLESKVLYPADGIRVTGEVIRKNKLGLYVVYRNALRIQVPRDLHIGNDEFDEVQIGDNVEVELKKSRFQINDAFILTNGLFVRRIGGDSKIVENVEDGVEEKKDME